MPVLIVLPRAQLCRCESSLAGWTGEIRLEVFKAEVFVSFRNHTESPRRAAVQVDHLCSLHQEASAVGALTGFPCQAEQSNPCSNSLALKVHASLPWNTAGARSRSFSGLWKELRCILIFISSRNRRKKKVKNKSKNKLSWTRKCKHAVCWCLLLAKYKNRLALSLAIEIIL